MALRWPWSRRADPVTPPPAPPEPAGPPPPSPMGWAFLPPIQRQLASPIATLSRDFEPTVWRSPGFTGELTHAVTDAVPAGVIDGDGKGLGQPVVGRTGGPELTLLPPPRPTVQRAVRAPAAEPPQVVAPPPAVEPPPTLEPTRAADLPPAEDPPSSAEPYGELAQVPTIGSTDRTTTSSEPTAPEHGAPVPVRAEPVVAQRSLVRADPTGLPLARPSVVQRAHVHGPADQVDEPAQGAAPAGPADAAPDSGRPDTDLPAHDDATGASSGVESSPVDAGPPPTAVQRTALGDSAPPPDHTTTPVHRERPRLGLGAPLQRVPDTAAEAPPSPGGHVATAAGRDGFTELTVPAPATPPTPPSTANLPVQRLQDTRPQAPAAADGSGSVAAGAVPPVGDATDLPGPVSPPAPEPAGEVSRATVAGAMSTDDAGPTGGAHAAADEPPLHLLRAVDDTDRGTLGERSPSAHTADPGLTAPAATGSTPALPPAFVPSTPLPLAQGISTSLQRSSVLPGPGRPTPALTVRAAGPVPSPTGRVVSVQRVAADPVPPVQRSAAPSAAHPGAPGGQSGSASPAPRAPAVSPPSPPPTLSAGVTDLPSPAPPASLTDPAPVPYDATPLRGGDTLQRAAESVPSYGAARVEPLGGPTRRAPDAHPIAVYAVPQTLAARRDEAAAQSNGAAVQRAAAGSLPDGGTAYVQREVAVDEVTTTVPDAAAEGAGMATTTSAPAAPAGGAGAAAGGPQPGGQDVEALARRLFPPILRLLRSELLVDRERRGIRTDRW